MRMTINIGTQFPEISGMLSEQFNAELVRLQQEASRNKCSVLVLDFGGTQTMSSTALGTLFAAHQRLGEQGCTLHVVNASEKIRRLMRMVNMTHLLNPPPDMP